MSRGVVGWCFAVIVLVFAGVEASAATRVPIQIDELLPRSVPWPITTGVPFPRNALHRLEQLRLVDDRGRPCLLQAKVAATWQPPGGPKDEGIRWLTIDFIAEPGRSYALEFGPQVTAPAATSPMRVDEGDSVIVTTGPLRASFHKSAPPAFWLDLNGDGAFANSEQVIGGSDPERGYVDQDGRRFTSGRDGADRRIVVESAGPVRACVRVDGFYRDPQGNHIVKYRTRYHFFAGLGLIKMVDEFGITGSTRGVRFADIALRFDLAPDAPRRVGQVRVAPLQDPSAAPLSVSLDGQTRGVSSYQQVYRHWGNPECRGAVAALGDAGEKTLHAGEKVGPWVQAIAGDVAVTGALRWFWQQFPKEWEVGDHGLTLHLWSPRGPGSGELDFSAEGFRAFVGPAGQKYLFDHPFVANTSPTSHLKWGGIDAILRGEGDGQGINKHHEIFLHLGPAADADAGAEYGRLADQQPIALASGAWNVSTDVFGPLAARAQDSPYESIYDRYIELFRKVQDDYGDYGWWVFGSGPHYINRWDPDTQRFYAEPVRFEYHTYGRETQMWWAYLRSGDRRYYDWCIPSENAWIDIAVTHVPLEIDEPRNGTNPGGRKVHWRPGDWSVDGPVHYLRQHDTAEHWLGAGAQFWASYHKTLETVTLAYYITGDERFADVIGYWRDYYKDLAGKTSASKDVQPWHQAESWWVPTKAGEPARTWARMHLDWAPFRSASRHKLPVLFNLATLYEATWDPAIGQAMREYADAVIDLESPTGTWRDQEFLAPQRAEVVHIPHFFTPALWKYHRVSGDPRMEQVFKLYFETAYHAHPFTGEAAAGYPHMHLPYGYYYTRDPKWLTPILRELERNLPRGLPLQAPEEIRDRLFNPYAPLEALTYTQRAMWALEQAAAQGIDVPARRPLDWPQRAPIIFRKLPGQPAALELWGFDPRPRLVGPDGNQVTPRVVDLGRWQTRLAPFDRVAEDHAAYVQRYELDRELPGGVYLLLPALETGVVAAPGAQDVAVCAAEPLWLEPPLTLSVRVPAEASTLVLESTDAAKLTLADSAGKPIALRVDPAARHRVQAQVAGGSLLTIGSANGWRGLHLRIVGWDRNDCWASVAPLSAGAAARATPSQVALLAMPQPQVPNDEVFVPGRFGSALLITPQRSLAISTQRDGGQSSILDPRQGTIELHVKRLWDHRTTPFKGATLLRNRTIGIWTDANRVASPRGAPPVPMNQWAHIALVWFPARQDPQRNIVHLYINGHDTGIYRSIWWPGYGDGAGRLRPPPKPEDLVQDLIASVSEDGAFLLDELRISRVPRYGDPNVEFGWQQVQNPVKATVPQGPFEKDQDTTLLMRFDGGLSDEVTGQTHATLR